MRGEVYRLKAPHRPRAHEQAGLRYAVVLQADDFPLTTWLVAPTSTSARPGPIRPEIAVAGRPTLVMVEHTRAVDPESRLGENVGTVTLREMQDIERALALVFGLRP
ncbi:MAG: type II toxin-antitoxin system PemK/MazF family toxin [Sporichthyaceae bacterium]